MTLFNKFVLMCKNNNVKFQTNIVKGTAYPWLILLFYENIDVLRKLKKECKDEKLKIGFNIPTDLLKERGIKL